METIHDLRTPALLLDVDALDRNLLWMANRARELDVALRPHAKSHKCVEIGRRQLDYGATGLTVSTLHEARVFIDHGFTDITWAYPVIHNRIAELVDLAARCRLRVTVDSVEAVTALSATGFPFEVFVKVDCGYRRAGVDPRSEYALTVVDSVTDRPPLTFAGILSHAGHAYGESRDDAERAATMEREVMAAFAARLQSTGFPTGIVSVGSTPGMRAVRSLEGVTETRPGNYVFYDYSQVLMGTCAPEECALTVLTSVISSQPGSDFSIVDAGALSLSKDPGPPRSSQPGYGELVPVVGPVHATGNHRIVGTSQEHGHLNTPLPVGSLARILPNHACLTAANFNELHVVQGEAVLDRWQVWSGR